MKRSDYLECAVARGTHGVRGNLRLESRCNTPADLAALRRLFIEKDGEYVPMEVEHASLQKGAVLAKLSGVDTLEAAAALRGTVFYAAREDIKLGRGEYFIADMIGLSVVDHESGHKYGTLSDVIRPGAQQIYVVKGENGEFMIPVVPEFIKEITVGDGGAVRVKLIEGMAD